LIAAIVSKPEHTAFVSTSSSRLPIASKSLPQ
jgi:hypothetical protein